MTQAHIEWVMCDEDIIILGEKRSCVQLKIHHIYPLGKPEKIPRLSH